MTEEEKTTVKIYFNSVSIIFEKKEKKEMSIRMTNGDVFELINDQEIDHFRKGHFAWADHKEKQGAPKAAGYVNFLRTEEQLKKTFYNIHEMQAVGICETIEECKPEY